MWELENSTANVLIATADFVHVAPVMWVIFSWVYQFKWVVVNELLLFVYKIINEFMENSYEELNFKVIQTTIFCTKWIKERNKIKIKNICKKE